MSVKNMTTEELKEEKQRLENKLKGFRGDHIPLDIAEKIGAVLNNKNRDRLNQIKNLAQQILDSAEKPEEEPEKEAGVTMEDAIFIIKETVTKVIEKAQGKID